MSAQSAMCTIVKTRLAARQGFLEREGSMIRHPIGRRTLALVACTFGITTAAAMNGRSQTGPTDLAPVRDEIQRLERVLPTVLDRGAALYVLARRYAQLGELDRARVHLMECLSLDEGFEPESDALKPLQGSADLSPRIDEFRQRHPAVHRAHVAFTVPENDLFPEVLAFDRKANVFYLGSEYHNKIIKVDADRHVSDFVSADRYHLSPVGGLRVDLVDRSLWAATDSSEFVHFDRQGRLLGRFATAEPGRHILNDLVVRRGGDIYVTDTAGHLVYRVDRTAHTFTAVRFHRPLFYPNGITLTPDERLLFVADMLGVIAIDLRTGLSHEVNRGRSTTLAGIDGLYFHNQALVGVQYGTGAYRVMRWRLSRDRLSVISSEVLEYRTDLVSFPTTGAIVGNDFYFIANTGIGNLKEGDVIDRTRLEPVHVAVVRLE
jgi:sugar lactone lactonase YvrE